VLVLPGLAAAASVLVPALAFALAEGLTEEGGTGVDLSGYTGFVVDDEFSLIGAGVLAMPKVGGLPEPFVPCLTK
jgi:hypothetical protein